MLIRCHTVKPQKKFKLYKREKKKHTKPGLAQKDSHKLCLCKSPIFESNFKRPKRCWWKMCSKSCYPELTAHFAANAVRLNGTSQSPLVGALSQSP